MTKLEAIVTGELALASSSDSRYIYGRPFSSRIVALAVVLIGLVITSAFLGELQARRASDLVPHTLSVQLTTTRLLALVEEAESGQRGFLLTGEESYLEPYLSALPQVPTALKALTDLTQDNPQQQQRIQRLEALIDARLQPLERSITIRRTQGLQAAIDQTRTGPGQAAMNRVRKAVAEINEHESGLLAARQARHEQILLVVRGVEVIGILMLALAGVLVVRQTKTAQAIRLLAYEAQKSAIESATSANRTKTEFLASMSHEIRTPLNGVIGNIELLARSGLKPAQEQLLFDAEKAAKSLLALIGNILDFSKIEAGKLTIEEVEMAPAALLQEAVDILQSRARQNNLFVSVAVGADVPQTVTGDPARLRQILLNLLGNAVKFTMQGGIHASLDVREIDSENCLLQFAVHDSGRGFTQSIAEELFQPFTQDTKQRVDNPEGTGLGLSISKSLIEAFGGTIGCDSVPGDGASFWFTLPAKVVHPAPHPSRADLRGRTITFIGEPNETPAHLVAYFRACGAEIMTIETSDAAISRAHTSRDSTLNFAIIVNPEKSWSGHWPPISITAELRKHHMVPAIYVPRTSHALWRKALGAGANFLLGEDTTEAFLNRNLDHVLGLPAHLGGRTDIANATLTHDPSIFIGKRVLVLEDRLVNQTVIQRQLNTFGLACTIATDGIAGLEALNNDDYDLILCDCSMPRMNGYDFTRALRTREGARRHTPVVAMTANAFREDMEKCFAAGMDDFLSKPVTLDRLGAVLAHWLAKA